MKATSVIITILFFVFNGSLQAQELICNVIINSDRVKTQEKQMFDDMQNAISNFLNNTKWTNDEFKEEEKIKCNLSLNFSTESNPSNGIYYANAQIQSVRPIYGTDYESPVLNFNDAKWVFEYNPSQPIIYSENAVNTELVSLLVYYAYIIIALDYDTFSRDGGKAYYEKAFNILNYIQSQDRVGPGWDPISGDTRDRYWIIENLNNQQFEPFRQALYEYHRLAFDTFDKEPDAARQTILRSLKKIQQVREVKPLAVMLNNFFDAKFEELLKIYSQGDINVRLEAVEILSSLDPTKSNNYKKLLK